MPDKYQIVIPFTGFYETVHGDAMDDAVDYALDCNEGEKQLEYDDLVIDMKGFMEEYSKAYLEAVSEFLSNNCDIDVEFEFFELFSPREYNFETDIITAYITEEGLNAILEHTDWGLMARIVIEAFTPRSGFAPFYTADFSQWVLQGVKEWDRVQLGLLLEQFIILSDIDVELGHEIASNHISYKGNNNG